MTDIMLGGGYDYLGLTADWPMPNLQVAEWDHIIERLWVVKKNNRGKYLYEPVKLGGHDFELQLKKPGGFFWLISETITIQLNPNMNPGFKAVIWPKGALTVGHDVLLEIIERVAIELGRPYFTSVPLNLSRLDYHLDLHVDEINFDARNILARGKKGIIFDNELNVETLTAGKRGKEHIFFRGYDKLGEIMEKGMKGQWNLEVLSQNEKFQPGRKIIRFEFEIGGQWLKRYSQQYNFRDIKILKAEGSWLPHYLVHNHLKLVEAGELDHENRHAARDAIILPIWGMVQDHVKIDDGAGWKHHRVVNRPVDFAIKDQRLLAREVIARERRAALWLAHGKQLGNAKASMDVADAINVNVDEHLMRVVNYQRDYRPLIPLPDGGELK